MARVPTWSDRGRGETPGRGREERAISVKFLNVARPPALGLGVPEQTEWCGVLPGNKFQ